MSVLTTNITPERHSFISTASKYERIPFSSERERLSHQSTKRAQGWEATYEWEASDGKRDLYYITLTKMEF